MVKGLPLISLSLTGTWSLCWPRLTAVYDTSYREGVVIATGSPLSGFLNHGHILGFAGGASREVVVMATDKLTL